ncbi:MAG: hypothetical protein M3536_11050 [Actinomycetota bacterium]|nr:hypothetical protein [Actinomycetota bacterium]
MGDHEATPVSTQTAHPWRATVRTVFAFLVGLAASWALIIQAAGIDPGLEWVSGSVAIAAGITRVMALPAVDDLIRRFLPFLAPDSK